jgi:dGTP triphosphohydrolase
MVEEQEQPNKDEKKDFEIPERWLKHLLMKIKSTNQVLINMRKKYQNRRDNCNIAIERELVSSIKERTDDLRVLIKALDDGLKTENIISMDKEALQLTPRQFEEQLPPDMEDIIKEKERIRNEFNENIRNGIIKNYKGYNLWKGRVCRGSINSKDELFDELKKLVPDVEGGGYS